MKRRQRDNASSATKREPLKLSRETLRRLTEDELTVVAGGRSCGCYAKAE